MYIVGFKDNLEHMAYALHHWQQSQEEILDSQTPEFAATMVLQNIANHVPNDTVSHARGLESSTTVLWEPQTSHLKICYICVYHSNIRWQNTKE